MGRDCDGEVGFLGGDCGIVHVRKEGGAIDVAVLAAIYNVKLATKEPSQSQDSHILDA